MDIKEPVTLEEFTKSSYLKSFDRKLFVQYGEKLVLPQPVQKLPSTASTLLIFPPEKGFTANEVKLLEESEATPFLQRKITLPLEFKSLLTTAMVSELYHPNEAWKMYEVLKSTQKNVK
jgi:16S rRNA U1498 N3-methylase RsmE